MEAINSSETSILTRVTRRHIPEYGILLKIGTFPPYNYLKPIMSQAWFMWYDVKSERASSQAPLEIPHVNNVPCFFSEVQENLRWSFRISIILTAHQHAIDSAVMAPRTVVRTGKDKNTWHWTMPWRQSAPIRLMRTQCYDMIYEQSWYQSNTTIKLYAVKYDINCHSRDKNKFKHVNITPKLLSGL
jgi:hypothetical protein